LLGAAAVAGWLAGPAAADPLFVNKLKAEPAVPVELVFEAEEFPGLPVYPDFHRGAGQGFYVKEHTHASGRAMVVCDSESERATIVKTFDRRLPAGDYLLGLCIVLTRWTRDVVTQYETPSGNIIRVELGLADGEGFRPVAIMRLQGLFGSGYCFLPRVTSVRTQYGENPRTGMDTARTTAVFEDPVLKVPEEWNAIRITAEKVISGGIGDVPEFALPYIILDRVKITNRPGYEWNFNARGRYGLLLPSELKEAALKAQSAPPVPGAPAGQGAPAPAAAPAPAGNLVCDGSFEAGGRPWWSPAMDGTDDFTFDPQDIIAGASPHGDRFARLALVQAQLYADDDARPKAYRAAIRSAEFTLPAGGGVVSFFARASVTPATLRLAWMDYTGAGKARQRRVLGRTEFTLDREWKQYSYRIESAAPAPVSLILAGESAANGALVDIDAVQVLAPGVDSRDYREGEGVRLLIANPAPYGTFHDNGPVRFQAVLVNGTSAGQTRRLRYRVTDLAGGLYGEGTVEVKGGKGITRRDFVLADFKGYGNFVLVAGPEAGPGPDRQLIPFTRVPEPARVEKDSRNPVYLGTLGRNIRGRSGRMMRHYGYEFTTTLNDVILNAGSNTLGYQRHAVYRNEVEQTRSTGLQWIPWIFPAQPAPYDITVLSSGPAATTRPWMSPEFGAWYTQWILERYQGLYGDMFIVTDELTNNTVPGSALPYVHSAYRAIKQKDPRLQVMNSIEFPPSEAFARELGGVKGVWTDALGGSRYGTDKWWYAREARFVREKQLPFYVTAVGWYFNYADLEYLTPDGRPLDPAKLFHTMNAQAWDLAAITAIYRPMRYSVYTGKYGSMATDPFNQFALYDGRPTAMAAQWIVLEQFMREAAPGELLRLKQASSVEACTFDIKGTTWVALHAPAPALLKRISLAVPAADLTILDMHLAPRPAAAVFATRSGETQFLMRRGETLFVGSRNPAFLEAARNLKATDEIDCRYAVLAREGKTVCAGFLKNNGAGKVTGRLDLYRNMLYRQGRESFPFALGPGEERIFEVAQEAGAFDGRPLTYYPAAAELTLDGFITAQPGEVEEALKATAEGQYMRGDNYFWLHYALPLSKEAAGLEVKRLEEWEETQSPASVYINWGLNGSYQRTQVRWGAENTDPNMRLDGSMDCDFMSRHYVRYDAQALYLGAIIEDQPSFAGAADPAAWGESVEYRLQPGLDGQLGLHRAPALRAIRVVQLAPDRLLATLAGPDGKTVALEGVCASRGDRREFLVRVPLELLGGGLKAGATLGLGITCFDSDDPSGKAEVEYDWSGAEFAPDDAFGFGQLILK